MCPNLKAVILFFSFFFSSKVCANFSLYNKAGVFNAKHTVLIGALFCMYVVTVYLYQSLEVNSKERCFGFDR